MTGVDLIQQSTDEAIHFGGKHRGLHRLGDSFGWRCQHCGCQVHCHTCEPNRLNVHRATRDHLVARSRGGGRGDNLLLACWRCNHTKANRPYNVPKPAKMLDVGKCVADQRQRQVRRSGRLRYGTRESAEAMCREVERRWGRQVIAYSCNRCHEWHIGKPGLSVEEVPGG